jgi:predicted nucleic acid-binding protein
VRVFPDTNALVGALATRGLCADLFQTILAGHDLVLGETLLLELERTSARKLHIEPKPIAELIAFLRQQGEVVAATGSVRLEVWDPKDRALSGGSRRRPGGRSGYW